MPKISLTRSVILMGITLSVFFVGLGSAKLWDRDEPRNSRASHEMLERSDWIVPTFNGALRDHKPVLLYWCQMCGYLAFGESEFTARLPSALASLLSVLAAAWLASRLSGLKRGISHEGFWAAGVLATSLLFVMAGRAATPDALLIAFSTAGIATLVVGSLAAWPPYSVGGVGKTRWTYALLGYALLGLAALAKGPVGIILPLAVVHVWWLGCYRMQLRAVSPSIPQPSSLAAVALTWLNELWQTFHPLQCLRAIWSLRAIPGILVCLAVAAPWYILVGMETEGAFLQGFFLNHNLGRAVQSMEGHSGSVLFYPAAFLVGTFPWSLWLLPVVMWSLKAARDNPVHRQMLMLSGSWVAIYLVAFSCASTKLPSYITPCYAGAAIAVAGYLRQLESRWWLPAIGWRYAAYSVAIVSGMGITSVVLWLSYERAMPDLRLAAWGGVAFVCLGSIAFGLDRLRQVTWIPACWLAAGVIFQVTLFGFGAKAVDGYRHEIEVIVDSNRRAPSDNWLAVGGMEPSWVHYLGKPISEVTVPATDPEAWRIVSEFIAAHPDARVIVSGETALARWQQLASSGHEAEKFDQIAVAARFLRPEQLAIYGMRAAPAMETPLAERNGHEPSRVAKQQPSANF